jgi:hypothetical protein
VFGICVEKSQATIIVSGDASIVRALDVNASMLFNPGDQQFFINILNGATDVAIVDQLDTNTFASLLNHYYSSVGNSSVSAISTITSSSLMNVGMLIVPVPEKAFSNDELKVMNNYIDSNGAVFFLGDASSSWASNNAIINQTLLSIGSSLSIVNDTLDRGIFKATGTEIIGDVFTNDIQSFTYGFVSTVNGGTSLFKTINGSSFIAYENVSVPEPSMAWLLVAGMFGLWGLIKRNKKK